MNNNSKAIFGSRLVLVDMDTPLPYEFMYVRYVWDKVHILLLHFIVTGFSVEKLQPNILLYQNFHYYFKVLNGSVRWFGYFGLDLYQFSHNHVYT